MHRRSHPPTAQLLAVPGLAVLLALAGCSTTAPPSPPPAAPSATPSATTPAPTPIAAKDSPDFDGDGQADLVVGIGDRPGRVSVRYANGGSLDFGRKDVDTEEADSVDFGQALLAGDLNNDGFADLIVADPGVVGPALFWIYGSATGLDLAGRAVTPTDVAVGAGRALALVTRPEPVVLVGGGGINSEAALLSYALGPDGRPVGDPAPVTPESLGLPALPAGSRFGATLAATGSLLVIGAPGATVGAARQAGSVYTVDYTAQPLRARRINEDTPGVPDTAETGDRFGAALAAGDGYLVVGVPGEDRPDERGHSQPGTGMVLPFQIRGDELQPLQALDQNDLPGRVEAGDGFGFAVSMLRPCANTIGVLVGAPAEAIGRTAQAGSVWVVPFAGDIACGAIQLYDSAGLGRTAEPNTLVGSAVGVLRLAHSPDTLVIVAQGTSEEGVPGRVLTLDHPYQDAPVEALDGLSVAEERRIALSPAEG